MADEQSKISSLIIIVVDQQLDEGRVKYATEVKLFGKWSYEGVECSDTSLVEYINLKTTKSQIFLPYTAGKYQKRSFQKVQCPVIERFLNSLMMKGRNNGKKQMAIRTLK